MDRKLEKQALELLASNKSKLDGLHRRIQSKLDELHDAFRQLKFDLPGTNQVSCAHQGIAGGI